MTINLKLGWSEISHITPCYVAFICWRTRGTVWLGSWNGMGIIKRRWFQLLDRDTGMTLTRYRGSNIGFAECGMGHKIKAGCRTREMLRTGYIRKISWRDRDWLISIGGMWDNLGIVNRMQDLNSNWPFGNLTRWGRDKDSESGGMAGWSQNYWQDAGLKKPILDPQYSE